MSRDLLHLTINIFAPILRNMKKPYSKLMAEYEARNKRIVAMRNKGLPFSEIGAMLGISRQRVQVIFKQCSGWYV